MEETRFLVARDLTELHQAMKLVPRSGQCVKCDDKAKLQCPACPSNQSCQFTVPVDCTQCPKSICVDNSETNSGSSSGGGSSGPSAGPIAGGVVGGIVAIAIIAFLVWKFLIKPKRLQAARQTVYEEEERVAQGAEKDGSPRITRRGSTHTVHSIASTVLTRASNIIQIAYIPGVTNRATPTSPTVLVPPVPPIPMHHTEGSRESTLDDPHFFVPGNLRDSTYSGISAYSDRNSFNRTSFAPRSSIASTIYGKQAQVLAPAQTGMRAKPTVVSVKAGSNTTSPASTPPIPSIDLGKFSDNVRPQSAASNFSVGSTFLNNANTATQARAQVVKVGGSGLRMVEIASKPEANASSTTLGTKIITISQPGSPESDQGPFSDPPAKASPVISINPPSLSVVEEVESVSGSSTASVPRQRGPSPFGDEHATKD